MRIIVLLLVAALCTPVSGCFGCTDYTRQANWVQDDVPIRPSGITIEYEFEGNWGGVTRNPDDNRMNLIVWGDNPVSHREMVAFAESMFENKTWPAPQLEGAEEEGGCGDQA